MIADLPLFSYVPARRSDPETSHGAGVAIDQHLPALERLVLKALRDRGTAGATSEEIADDLDLPRVTVSPRLRPLANKGLIRDSNTRRPGLSGRPGIVWVIENHRIEGAIE